MRRREFLAAGTAAVTARQKKTILLRSGWQAENIGDIAHTPGVLGLLEKHVPEAKVIVWSNGLDLGAGEMLKRHFPKVAFVSGTRNSAEVREAFAKADFLLHGSGPSVVAAGHVAEWRKETGKPYGIFGVTVSLQSEGAGGGLDAGLREVIEGARFIFTRETKSLENLRKAGFEGGGKGPEIGFVPDGTFSCVIRDDRKAAALLKENGLERGKFAAFVPRLRYTPYHKMRKVSWSEAETRKREEINERHAEADHAKMRAAIVEWVRKTGGRALLCPEMTYEVEIIDPLLFEPLPADVKARVARCKAYWLTDEAAAVYRQAAAVASFECHSPILAAAQGTPCMYLRQPEDTIKGQMWEDVGLSDSKMEIEAVSGAEVAARVVSMARERNRWLKQIEAGVERARKLQADGMRVVRRELGLPG